MACDSGGRAGSWRATVVRLEKACNRSWRATRSFSAAPERLAGGRRSCVGRSGRSSHNHDAALRIRTCSLQTRTQIACITSKAGRVDEVGIAGTPCDGGA
jgi:hypothetical protein